MKKKTLNFGMGYLFLKNQVYAPVLPFMEMVIVDRFVVLKVLSKDERMFISGCIFRRKKPRLLCDKVLDFCN